MTAQEILDGCRHDDAHIAQADGHDDEVRAPCYACAQLAIAAAVQAERERIAAAIDSSETDSFDSVCTENHTSFGTGPCCEVYVRLKLATLIRGTP